MNTRKLFQTTNQSTDCVYFCDSSCPFACYPYVDLDYYIPPPPPPPPLPPPLSSTNKHHLNVSPYIIISVALFTSLFLLVSYYLIIVKNFLNLNRRRTTPSTQSSDEEFFDENRAPVIDHPIWYINTIGLQPSVIEKITIFKFKKGNDMIIEGTEFCSVCLNEFQDDESLRLLPNCKHAFHIHCIDTWLRSHTNCPLCRAAIDPNVSTSLDTMLENDAQRDDTGNVDEEIRASGDQEEFLLIEKMGTSRNEVHSKRGCVNEEANPMRRSVSMDSSMSASVGLDMIKLSRMSADCVETARMEETSGENSSSSASMAISQHYKEHVLMKKSFSYGGRSFFSRHHRSRSSSVLPL